MNCKSLISIQLLFTFKFHTNWIVNSKIGILHKRNQTQNFGRPIQNFELLLSRLTFSFLRFLVYFNFYVNLTINKTMVKVFWPYKIITLDIRLRWKYLRIMIFVRRGRRSCLPRVSPVSALRISSNYVV